MGSRRIFSMSLRDLVDTLLSLKLLLQFLDLFVIVFAILPLGIDQLELKMRNLVLHFRDFSLIHSLNLLFFATTA